LAQLLEKTAKQELVQHFAEEAALAEIVRSGVDNLEDAIASESYGTESMYRDFAEKLSPRATKPSAIALKRFATTK
jgi:rubrerythrin